MKKRLFKILCVVLSVVIVVVSITFLKKDKPVNQPIDTNQNTTEEQATGEGKTTETTTEEPTETTTIPEETTVVKPTQPIKIDSLQSLITATGIKYNAMSIQVATRRFSLFLHLMVKRKINIKSTRL